MTGIRGIHTLRNLAAEGDHIARRFEALHRDGMAWSDMAVIYRFRFIGEELASQLRAAGVPFSWLKKGDGHQTEGAGDSVKLVTFHSSKGLEFPVAAIPGLGFLPDFRSDENDEVRLAYVAMTRAMDRLIVTYHWRSVFVGRLLDSGAPVAA